MQKYMTYKSWEHHFWLLQDYRILTSIDYNTGKVKWDIPKSIQTRGPRKYKISKRAVYKEFIDRFRHSR
jgi:hypothetical protein